MVEQPAEDPEAEVDMDVGRGELSSAAKRLSAADRLMKKYRFDQAIKNYQQAIKHYEEAAPAVEEETAAGEQ